SRRSPSINSKKISQKNKKSVDKTKKEEKEDTQNPVRSPTVDCKKTFQRIKAEEKTTKEDSPNLVQSPEVSKKAHLELELGAEDACAETPTSACFPTGVTEESSNAQKTPVSAEMVVPPTDQIAAPRSAASTQSDSTSFRRRMIKTHSSVQSNPVSAVFRKPVKDSDAPGYSVIVKRPMDLRTLARKLRDGEVTSAEEYRRDLMLMLANAVMFNHEDSQVSKNAKELMIDCDRLVSIFMRGSRY
ncbi:Bromodomain-containing protein, partial [Phakopsora pachyrhizi]